MTTSLAAGMTDGTSSLQDTAVVAITGNGKNGAVSHGKDGHMGILDTVQEAAKKTVDKGDQEN